MAKAAAAEMLLGGVWWSGAVWWWHCSAGGAHCDNAVLTVLTLSLSLGWLTPVKSVSSLVAAFSLANSAQCGSRQNTAINRQLMLLMPYTSITHYHDRQHQITDEIAEERRRENSFALKEEFSLPGRTVAESESSSKHAHTHTHCLSLNSNKWVQQKREVCERRGGKRSAAERSKGWAVMRRICSCSLEKMRQFEV